MRRRPAHLELWLASVGLTLACNTLRDETVGQASAEAGGGAEETGADDAPDGDDGSPASSGGDGGTKLDVGFPNATEGDGDDHEGCEKIDFLFVVDNSSSMADQQESLANSFPGFIAAIEDTLNIQDFRIMVVDSDEWGPLHGGQVQDAHQCTPWLSSNPVAAICDPPNVNCCSGECPDHPMKRCDPSNGGLANGVCAMPPDACDITLGAGVVRDYPTLEPCDIEGSQRFLTSGQPDLQSVFDCVALVGEDGNFDERPMGAMMRAVSPEFVGAGGCNEGFLRDDALLVVTVLSDAVPESACEQQSPTPELWHQALVDAKHGDPEAVVVLGLFSGREPYGWQERCRRASKGYWEFLDLFGDNALGASICEPDYSPFFLEAVQKRIKGACEEFVPPEG